MRPTAHFHLGIVMIAILAAVDANFSWWNGFLFLAATVGLDTDKLLKIWINENNHRRYWTHFPGLWIVILGISQLIQQLWLTYIALACLVHLAIDWIDWGLPLYPSSTAPLWPHLLTVDFNPSDETYFYHEYWNNIVIRSVEGILTLLALISWFYLSFLLQIYGIIAATIVYTQCFIEWRYYRLRQEKK